MAFSPDGTHVLSGQYQCELKLWDVRTGRLLQTMTHNDALRRCTVRAIAFSPDGRRALSGVYTSGMSSSSGEVDNSIKLWDLQTGRELRAFDGHRRGTVFVGFSASGRRVIAGGVDGTVKIWNTGTGELLATTVAGRGGEWATLIPEGYFVASAKGAELLSAVQGVKILPIASVYAILHRPDLVRDKIAGDPKDRVGRAAAADRVRLQGGLSGAQSRH